MKSQTRKAQSPTVHIDASISAHIKGNPAMAAALLDEKRRLNERTERLRKAMRDHDRNVESL